MKPVEVRERIGNQGVLPGWEEEVAGALTANKERVIGRFWTQPDPDSPFQVMAMKSTMPPVLAEALVARYSRAAETDIRDLFWEEFVKEGLTGEDVYSEDLEGRLGEEKAREMIRRILDRFGDDSVRELASGTVMVQGASVLTMMEAFSHPLVSGIGASTRYIDWRERDREGNYRYVRPEAIMESREAEFYEKSMNGLFGAYELMWPRVWDFVVENNPKPEEMSEGAYRVAVQGQVCDILRKLLPLGIVNNFGLHANMRTFSEVIFRMAANDSGEAREVARQLFLALKKVNPESVAVCDSARGRESIIHLVERGNRLGRWGRFAAGGDMGEVEVVMTGRREALVASLMVGGNEGFDFEDLMTMGVERMGWDEYIRELAKLMEVRGNRRHKVPDEFEGLGVEVGVRGSFSVYKDFQRHRKVDWRSEPWWEGLGEYYIPQAITEMGGNTLYVYREAQEMALEAYHQLLRETRLTEARGVLTHGTMTNFKMGMGLGELIWLCEIRTIPSGDPEYRRLAQKIWRRAMEVMPELRVIKTFVDMNEYPLGRIGEAVRADLRGGKR
jgi:thymidylate synthase ThyX